MITNRLAQTGENSGRVTVDTLEQLADDLNKEPWVRGMGRHYHVSREPNPKYVYGSLDHKERQFIHSLAWAGVR